MDKLQYDSFYKFVVSVGVFLIITPLIGVYYILSNSKQLLISQADYNALSTNSLCFLQLRDRIFLVFLDYFLYIFLVLMAIGVGCFIFGSFKWYVIQKEIDEQTKLKTQEQKLNIERMSVVEVAEKVAKEIVEDTDTSEFVSEKSKYTGSKFIRMLTIEQKCHDYILKKVSKLYDVYQNMKVGKIEYDIIAISKRDTIDLLYEVKYFSKGLEERRLKPIVTREEIKGKEYEISTLRNCRNILIAVVPDTLYEESVKQGHLFSEKNNTTVKIHIVKESYLGVEKT